MPAKHERASTWERFAERIAKSKKPILCGPWRSEVGFEVLYWIPFLTHFREQYKIAKDRLVYIGRGGSSAWFDSAGKADLFEFLPVDSVRTLTTLAAQQTGSIKQTSVPQWEMSVCDLAATTMGLSEYEVLSPKWMYQTLAPFWEGREGLKWLDQHTLHQVTMPTPALSHELKQQLPERYIAMRWYVRPTWPLREDLVLWTRRLVEQVAQKTPVVLINSGFQADDHADVNLGPIPNVHTLTEITNLTPLNNLAIQSSVIAHADAYMGTYGGMAQGAMRWGVPTIALYQEFGQTSPQHLHLTQSLSLKSGAPFLALTPQQVDPLLALVQGRELVTA